ncbi:C-terminal processing peptidase [Enterovibrio norvegicus]|uniref:carboxy terminal-processing peptidase n=1 Tax=Enterovibrio norvegicus TaxID=188144 RepID=UPI000C834B26|nr:carboxy terminal-processing peptidase [Enterovibrio norvegicus]PMH65712.1 C-terminal processing peptidase [Enterovibrio norvegicus]PMI27490.1 C-terminal processing peptidase [Enterovibrio norvegicus]PMI36364.1 C-terminal processing peptidase [Enterovibrio norvegicus]PMN51313.1 C-terminal processing peptidase [Enterovibrio norvegicus]TKF13454.1 carboxy terminal-processing peptidase [Enterovibrio norvegicus]
MTCRIRFSVIAASIMLAASAHAIEAKYESSDLPTLVSEPQHKTASKRITRRFEKSHYKQFQLNDAFSAEVFDRYLETLDFNRLFLTQEQVDMLSKWRSEFDDQLRSGETTAAYDIFNASLQKRFERYQYALSLLDNEITFDANDDMLVDRSEEPWAKNDAELNELWRLRVKNDALNLKLAGKDWPDIRDTLKKRYNNALKRLTQTKSEDVFQIYLNAFSREVDPHTSYLSPRNAEQFQSEMNLSLEGIGAVLQVEDDFTVIRSLVAGGPASSSKKLSPGDRIIGVAQDDDKVVDVIGWRLDDVVQLIKGPKGSKVKLEILPEGANSKSYKVTIVRDKIRLEDRAVKSELIEEGSAKVGVISVPSFYVGLAEDTKKEIAKLKKDKVSGIVIDLRNNGGGALSEASALTGLFINGGPVVQVRDSYGRVKVNSDSDNAIYYDGPVTVLINRYSASASEIFAAALQDYGRAVILGEQSFGKGTVQQHRSLNHIYDLFDKPLGHVQYTIQKFYRINGGSTQNLGVVPDIAFPTAVDPEETGESVEENALPWDSINPAAYSTVGNTNSLVVELGKLHQSRIKNDEEFGFIAEDIAEYKAIKDDNVISLNEKSRIAEREEEDKKRLARLNDRQKMLGKKAFKTLDDVPSDYEQPDAYLNEAALITLDMARAK